MTSPTNFIALPAGATFSNGQPCDMLIGPCSCGAWHQPEGWVTFQMDGNPIAVVRKDAVPILWPEKK